MYWESIKQSWAEVGWNIKDIPTSHIVNNAKRWYYAGWRDAKEALQWATANWLHNPKEALRWKYADWDPLYAWLWYEAGWKVEHASEWVQVWDLNFPYLAIAWQEAGWTNPRDALAWYRAGWKQCPDIALQWYELETWKDIPEIAYDWETEFTPLYENRLFYLCDVPPSHYISALLYELGYRDIKEAFNYFINMFNKDWQNESAKYLDKTSNEHAQYAFAWFLINIPIEEMLKHSPTSALNILRQSKSLTKGGM